MRRMGGVVMSFRKSKNTRPANDSQREVSVHFYINTSTQQLSWEFHYHLKICYLIDHSFHIHNKRHVLAIQNAILMYTRKEIIKTKRYPT